MPSVGLLYPSKTLRDYTAHTPTITSVSMKQFFDADNHPLRPLTNLSLQNPSHTSRTPSMLRSKTLTKQHNFQKDRYTECHPTLGSAVECSITSKRLFISCIPLSNTTNHHQSTYLSALLYISTHATPALIKQINPHPSFQILQTNLPHRAPPNIDTHPLHPTPGSPLSRPFSCPLIPFPTDSRHRIFGRIFRGGGRDGW